MTNVACACFCVSVNFYVQNGGYIYFPRSEFPGSSVYINYIYIYINL